MLHRAGHVDPRGGLRFRLHLLREVVRGRVLLHVGLLPDDLPVDDSDHHGDLRAVPSAGPSAVVRNRRGDGARGAEVVRHLAVMYGDSFVLFLPSSLT